MMFHYLVLLHYSMVCFLHPSGSSFIRRAPDLTAPLLCVECVVLLYSLLVDDQSDSQLVLGRNLLLHVDVVTAGLLAILPRV
jgi:hypothetical protein